MRKKFHAKRAIFIGDCAFGRRPSLQYLDRNEYMNGGIQVGSAIQEYSHGICLHRCGLPEGSGHICKRGCCEMEYRWNGSERGQEIQKQEGDRRLQQGREQEDIIDIEEKAIMVKGIISSGRKGSDLIDALSKLRSYTTASETKLNDEKIEIMKKLAGRFMIVTDTDLSLDEIVKSYKDLWKKDSSER